MPRKARIDAPGALHHIIARGIERRLIFQNDDDRDSFLDRLGDILQHTNTACYAWALIPNHFHLLLRTGDVSISKVMRRLLTGHALWYNRRHRRHGHLFQNRYKSILCQEDVYFLELVRYIQLNPVRAGLVADLKQLDRYPYCGHSVLMGTWKKPWQDITGVLGMFGDKMGASRRAYRIFVEKGIAMGKRPDLTGGGLIRSAGGWEAVKDLKKEKLFQRSDERILGDGDFVQSVLDSAEEAMERRYALQSRGYDLEKVALRVAEVLRVPREDVWGRGRYRHIVVARSLLCYWAVRELGFSMSTLSHRLAISIPAVSKSVLRGEDLAKRKSYALVAKLKS